MKTGGELIVRALEGQGVGRIFTVPGESFLAVLDALYDSTIDVIVCRQEGGAAMMAEATGKLSGRPGVAIVTRGPGATNAASGVHVAQQDSTPMVLLVGQIERGIRGRDAFQEVDFVQFFGKMAKWVAEVDSADRVPEMMARAFHTAMSGRPGPVVLALPEDVLRERAEVVTPKRIEVAEPAPSPQDMERFATLLKSCTRPITIVGGSRWTPEGVSLLHQFSERFSLPVACSFRRQMLFDHQHPHYAGDAGLGINPKLRDRITNADLVILIGGRFSENPSQNYTALQIPTPVQNLIHVHPGPEELGRVYIPKLAVNATPETFLDATRVIDPPDPLRWSDRAADAHAEYDAWTEQPGKTPGKVQLGEIVSWLRDHVPADSIVTNGAGNYAIWVHRYWRFSRFGTQVAPIAGSMGYGLPGAIAAKLEYPDRTVICFAGDGCFQMTMQEFGTSIQSGAPIIVIVVDNGIYGTIRMHQERSYPGRVASTTLENPDFAGFARLYGGHGETVTETSEFVPAFQRAIGSGLPSVLHVKTDPEAITPSLTLSDLNQIVSASK